MNAHSIFRLIHIIGGIAWVGAAVFVAAFLLPAARTVGPAAAPLVREINEGRKLHLYMMFMSWFTLVSGFTLAWRDAGPMGMRWFEQGMGLVFGIGGVVAVAASAVGMAIIAPAGKKIAALNGLLQQEKREPNPSEIAAQRALQDRLYFGARLGALLLLIASAAMAFARYM